MTQRFNIWSFFSLLIGLLILFPLLSILYLASNPTENIWPHLFSTVLPEYIQTTLQLFFGVGLLSLVVGFSSAWVVTMYNFPFRRYFSWLLLLPLAMPTYVIAYAYTDIFEYSGPFQIFLRSIFSPELPDVFPIRSLWGAIFTMSFVLYPYIYITARASFLELSPSMIESSKVLNRGLFYTLFKVVMPLARPSIIVGLSLVLLEVLNDFGTVDYFALKTFSVGIYDVWLNMGNLGGAAQIATVALFFVFVLIFVERFQRRKQRFFQTKNSKSNTQRPNLSKPNETICFLICFCPILIGFIIPTLILSYYSIINFTDSWTSDFQTYVINSLTLAILASLGTIIVAIFLVYGSWVNNSSFIRFINRISITGYALPGIVLAIGIFYPFTRADHWLNAHISNNLGLYLSGGTFILICAYIIRFLSIAQGSIESSFNRISPSLDMTARSLGYTRSFILFNFHLPALRTGILSALLLVFVDTMKELPTTLFLRPFNFDTLATNVYQFASDEQLEKCALGALFIVLSGLLPIILLNRTLTNND